MKSVNKKRKIIIAVILILTLFFTWIIWTNLAIKTSDITIENNKIPEEFNNFKIDRYQIYITVNWGTGL